MGLTRSQAMAMVERVAIQDKIFQFDTVANILLHRGAMIEAHPAKKAFEITSSFLTLVQEKMPNYQEYVNISQCCRMLCRELAAPTEGTNRGDLCPSVRIAIQGSEQVLSEPELAPRWKVGVQCADCIREGNPCIQEDQRICDSLHATTPLNQNACERLIKRKFSLCELPSLIRGASIKENDEKIRRLPVDDAQALIDVVDEALHTPNLSPTTQKKCLKLLYRTCGQHALLPKTFEVPVHYNRGNEPSFSGGFGDVWMGECNGQNVAVKVIRTRSSCELQKMINMFCKEVVMWRSLRHPNILPLIGVSMPSEKHRLAMISDWMVNGNINEFIKSHPDADQLRLLRGVAEGLIYIHANEMVHGDLKGSNILIDENWNARLADFGLLTIVSDPANSLSSSSNTQGGTARWMSPELIVPEKFQLKTSRRTRSSDCYALGMVIYEVISGKLPFHEDADLTVFVKVIEGKHPDRGARFPGDLWKMLEMCWAFQPRNRPSVDDVHWTLEVVSGSLELPSPDVDEEMEDSSDWGTPNVSSVVQNKMRIRVGTAIFSDPNPVPNRRSDHTLQVSQPLAAGTVGNVTAKNLGHKGSHSNLQIPAYRPMTLLSKPRSPAEFPNELEEIFDHRREIQHDCSSAWIEDSFGGEQDASSIQRTPPPATHLSGEQKGGGRIALKRGKLTNKPPKTHQRAVREKRSPHRGGLAMHMDSYSGLRAYCCPVESCDKSFAMRAIAKRHIRTHAKQAGCRSTDMCLW